MSARSAVALLALVLVPSPAGAQAPPTASGGSAPLPSALSLGASFDDEMLSDLPGGRRAWSQVETIDATTIADRMDNGGLFTGEASLFSAHGASWTQVSYQLGALDITDPDLTGVPLFLPDPGTFTRVELTSGLRSAEHAGPGPSLTFVPRHAGGAWEGSVAGTLLPAGLQGQTPAGPPAVAHYDALHGGRFRVGGPLSRERLGLLVSGSAMRVRRLDRGALSSVEGFEAGVLTHLHWKAGGRDEVRFIAGLQKARHPYSGRARFRGDPSQADRFWNVQASWERRSTTPFAASAGYARGESRPDLGSSATGATVERLRSGPVARLFAGDRTRERGHLTARVEPIRGRFRSGEQAFALGLSTSWTRAVTRPPGPPTLTAESLNGIPARVWDYGWKGPESRWRTFDLAAYATGRVRWGRVSLDAGFRFEHTHARAAAGPGDIVWTALSPRLSARADLTPGGGLAFRAGFARYRHLMPLELLAFGDPAAAQGQVYRWLDRNEDGRFEAGEQGPLVAPVGPGGPSASIDPGLRAPRTEEVVVGLEARFARTWTASLVGIHRRERNLVASTNVGAPAATAYSVRFVPDPGGDILGPEDDQLLPIFDRRPESFGQDRYLLGNTDENVLHEGVEIALRGTAGERLRVFFGGTASRSVGPGAHRGFEAAENDAGLVGERLLNPNAATYARGRLFFDRAFTLKLAATWRGPGDLRLGAAARYQDGQPFSRLVIATDLAQGPEAVQAIPNGRSRFTYTLTLDARAEKGVRVGRARLALALEAFNLLDMANEVEEDVTTGPTFRAVTAVQPPRAVLLELRAEF